MTTTLRKIAIAATMILSCSAFAQDTATPTASPASAPAQAGCASMAPDRHDHAAERGMPGSRSKGCASDKTKSAKKKSGHDHARVHKLM